MAQASRRFATAVTPENGGWTPRTEEVSPALARMHERLRAARVPGAAGLRVPAVALRDDAAPAAVAADARAEAVCAMQGGTAPIERSPVALDAPARLSSTLDRFVRLRGRSGRTYVFSRIEPRHVSLYRDGVFATAPRGAAMASVVGDVAPILSNAVSDDLLFVHLLSGTPGERAAVIADLR